MKDRTIVVEDLYIITDKNLGQEATIPYAGHLFSDYVLLRRDSKGLGCIEAKKNWADAAIGRESAKHYNGHIQNNQGSDVTLGFGHFLFLVDRM